MSISKSLIDPIAVELDMALDYREARFRVHDSAGHHRKSKRGRSRSMRGWALRRIGFALSENEGVVNHPSLRQVRHGRLNVWPRLRPNIGGRTRIKCRSHTASDDCGGT